MPRYLTVRTGRCRRHLQARGGRRGREHSAAMPLPPTPRAGQCQDGAHVLSSAAITGRGPVLTVTRDMILPTTVTGSYPRPLWFDRSLEGRSFKSALGDSLFREQYLDAVGSMIDEQEAEGLG